MSWQVYVDSNLVGTGKVTKAAILGQQGGIWATSAGFALSAGEQKEIIHAFDDINGTQSKGIRAAGIKYFFLRSTDRSIYGKKEGDGILVVKTKQAILVAVYEAPIQAAEATPIVEGVADYLVSVNY